MSRKTKRNAERKANRVVQSQVSKDIGQIFFGQDNELITETLIIELKQAGWQESDLRFFQEIDATYCRPRNSFIS